MIITTLRPNGCGRRALPGCVTPSAKGVARDAVITPSTRRTGGAWHSAPPGSTPQLRHAVGGRGDHRDVLGKVVQVLADPERVPMVEVHQAVVAAGLGRGGEPGEHRDLGGRRGAVRGPADLGRDLLV